MRNQPVQNQGLLDELGNALNQMLAERQHEFTPEQQNQLLGYRRNIQQYQNNPEMLTSNPGAMNGILGQIIQIAGPILAGYLTHRFLEQMGQSGLGSFGGDVGSLGGSAGPFGGSSGPFGGSAGPFDQGSAGPFGSSDGPFNENQGNPQQDNTVRHSTSRGQSVEEG